LTRHGRRAPSPSTPQRPSAGLRWRTALVSGTGGLKLALLVGWIFSGSNGAGTDAAHASAAEGYGFTPEPRAADPAAADS
jgi:hypothetical protein